MLTDFRDANLDIIIMSRDTDGFHQFQPKLENGSTFVWNQYTVVCEGRAAIRNEKNDFTFATSSVAVDGEPYIRIDFPKEVITSYIRENKIYWRVLATHNGSGKTILLRYGEIWLS